MRRKFSLLMFVMFFSHALLFTQIIPFLIALGYSANQRSYLVASYAAFSMLGQIVFGYLSDRHASIKKFIIILTYLIIVSGLLAYSYADISFIAHFVAMSVTAGSTRIVGNLFETWILELDEIHDDFSYIRSYGSLGWALASLGSGYLVLKFGYSSLGYLAAILGVLIVFIASSAKDAQKENSEGLSFLDVKELLSNKNYIVLILVFFFAYLIYNTDTITITEYIFELGGSAQDVGSKWFIQAMSEIPMLFVGSKLLKKYNAKGMLTISLILLMLRYVLTGLSGSTNQIILLSLLQAFTFPIMLISQRHLVFREVPSHLKSTGQMLAVSLSIGLSSIVAPLVSALLMNFMTTSKVIISLGFSLFIPIALLALYD